MPSAPRRGGGGAGPDASPASPPRHGEDGGVCVQGAASELLSWQGRGRGLTGRARLAGVRWVEEPLLLWICFC